MQVVKPFPFRAPARNGALLYMACGNVSVRSARLLPGSLTCHRSRQLASLRSVQGARPLRRSAAIPMTLLCHFLPAGHAKHGAAPTGAFDWTQSGQSGAWGNPNKLHRNIENDIPMPCLPMIGSLYAGWEESSNFNSCTCFKNLCASGLISSAYKRPYGSEKFHCTGTVFKDGWILCQRSWVSSSTPFSSQ